MVLIRAIRGRHNSQHNDTQHNYTQHNGLTHDIQHNDTHSILDLLKTFNINDTQPRHCIIVLSAIMLSVVMPNVVMLSVVKLGVVAPIRG